MERICKRVNKKFPCRSEIVRTLVELIGDARETLPNSIYVYGNAGTGKTGLMKEILRQARKRSNIHSAFLNLVECYATKIFLELILSNLLPKERAGMELRCDTLKEFITQILQWPELLEDDVGYIIVLDGAERVRDMDANILPTFMRLHELTGLNICCVLISKLPFEKFYCKTGLSEIIALHLPQYTKNETQKILSNDFPHVQEHMRCQLQEKQEDVDNFQARLQVLESISLEFFNNYLNIFLNVFYKACRDLPELKLTARNCFYIYLEPVLNGSIEPNDMARLWRHIAGPLRTALSQVYLRFDRSAGQDPHRVMNSANQPDLLDQSVKKMAQSLELPYYGKFLLIAAFLASHNSAKSDKRLFVKHHGKQRKRMQSVNAKAKVSDKMSTSLGPKSFSIDRLLAIFYAIIEDKVGLTCNMLSQVSTLVHLKLLTFVSGENSIMEGSARLQCTVGLEFILYIGQVVGFNVQQYLLDFM